MAPEKNISKALSSAAGTTYSSAEGFRDSLVNVDLVVGDEGGKAEVSQLHLRSFIQKYVIKLYVSVGL